MLLEICVDTLEGAQAAVRGGAGRVELCSSLSEGGLTPSAGLMRAAKSLPVPVYAMIRPRSGLFHFSPEDEGIMLADIDAAKAAGLAGVVLGVQQSDGHLDRPLLERLSAGASGMGRTLHRVIDVVPAPLSALQIAMDLGFERVLTSGSEPFAPDGVGLVKQMVNQAAGQISIMPGCGLTPENVGDVIRATGVLEVHAACSIRVPGDPAFSDFDPAGGRFVTDEGEVSKMVVALSNAIAS
ncbi:copper homeostasis protein [Roseibium hamelinense]|uniref:PF03932 family protein CutC n=1 Tax=Roseibium hamelinense TaxID=150831 RepID=A0A562T9D5_9HYPH|nr:copper homeostasis protein CutC [Roseibium hamelinense]MTI45399.1 copper homeostasis protein CutC [Roseibium hamelinense]TWI90229.1 copper homeostasis protein [Roseibium hamelinense]